MDTSPALTEKECRRPGCSNTFLTDAPARKFCALHATGKTITVDRTRHQPGALFPKHQAPDATINEAFSAFIVPIYVTEPQLDDFWTKLPIEEKALAIQLYWDNSNSSEETKTSAPAPEQLSND